MIKVPRVDICLINTVPEHRLLPLGLAYIASFLESYNHKVSIVDLGVHFNEVTLTNLLSAQSYEIAGISCMTPFFKNAVMAANVSKKIKSNAITVLGGPHICAKPSDILRIDDIDIGVIGEGEFTTLDLMKWKKGNVTLNSVNGIVYKKNGKLVFTKPREPICNISALPFPAYHLLPLESYVRKNNDVIRGVFGLRVACMIASRGCPHPCIFCSSWKTHGKKTRYREPKNVVAEIDYLMSEHNIEAVYFCDDTFTHNPEWVYNFCREIMDKKINVFWACQARIDSVSKHMLQAMKRAGCIQVEFGVESGCQRILDFLKKNISIEQIHNAFRVCRSTNMRTLANVMIGSPGESLQDVEATRQLIEELDPDYVALWLTTPLPGTGLYLYAKQYGLITTVDYDKFRYDMPIMETGILDLQNIKSLYKGLQSYYDQRNKRRVLHL